MANPDSKRCMGLQSEGRSRMRSVIGAQMQSFFELTELKTKIYRRKLVKSVDSFVGTPGTGVSPWRADVYVI